ncbi:histidine kinase [Natronorarus salvus]|uniref:histidine kinase n=1 Tax=Natronorarus salvus TaxID=3117733 RepID=UPI002F26534C
MDDRWWLGGALGGAIGAVGFGALAFLLDPEFLEATVPGLYGVEAATGIGVALHLVHGAVLGLVFAAILGSDAFARTVGEEPVLGDTAATVRAGLAGLAYGVAIWALLPVVVVPLWAAGTGIEAEVPTLALESLLGHVVYGLLLGATYAAVTGR